MARLLLYRLFSWLILLLFTVVSDFALVLSRLSSCFSLLFFGFLGFFLCALYIHRAKTIPRVELNELNVRFRLFLTLVHLFLCVLLLYIFSLLF